MAWALGGSVSAGKLSAAVSVCTHATLLPTWLWWTGVFFTDATRSAISVLPGSLRGTGPKLAAPTLVVGLRHLSKTRFHRVTLQKGDHGAGFCYDRLIKEFILKNQEDIDSVADAVVEMAIEYGKRQDGPLVIALQGELGAGKTTFTKSFAKRLGIAESVASPTFVILKRYAVSAKEFLFHNLIHIDAYRLENGKELEKIGLSKLMQEGQKNIICIEWPEIVEDILPPNRLAIRFEHLHHTDNSEMRKVTIEQKM